MNQPSQLVQAPEDIERFTVWAQQQGWADGLPLIPPTTERVETMARTAGRPLWQEIGRIPPRDAVATVEVLAANAVMAGCHPGHLSVLTAAVEALLDPQLNLQGLQVTTNPAAPLLIVNGPIRQRLDIAGGGDALSGGNPANLAIGRALQLLLRNVGGAHPPIDQSVLGSPAKRGLVLGENEQDSPWLPLHVRRGIPEANAVTVLHVESLVNVPAPYRSAEAILQMMALAMCNGLNLHYSSGVLLACFNPTHARILAEAGYEVEQVRDELFRRARVPVSAYPAEGNASQAEWVREGDQVLMTDDRSKVEVMVAGSAWPAHSMCFNGWSISGIASRPVAPGQDPAPATPHTSGHSDPHEGGQTGEEKA